MRVFSDVFDECFFSVGYTKNSCEKGGKFHDKRQRIRYNIINPMRKTKPSDSTTKPHTPRTILMQRGDEKTWKIPTHEKNFPLFTW